jgi:hypothetical protein
VLLRDVIDRGVFWIGGDKPFSQRAENYLPSSPTPQPPKGKKKKAHPSRQSPLFSSLFFRPTTNSGKKTRRLRVPQTKFTTTTPPKSITQFGIKTDPKRAGRQSMYVCVFHLDWRPASPFFSFGGEARLAKQRCGREGGETRETPGFGVLGFGLLGVACVCVCVMVAWMEGGGCCC